MPGSPLFARLKSGTAHQHQAIEAAVDPYHAFSSLETYKAHLLNTWSVHAPLEDGLGALDWPALGIDYAARRKTPLIEHDLRILGVPHPMATEVQRPATGTDLSFPLGCLYVLEGATLGGQVISRHLASLGIGASNGGRFFNGYGTRTGEMWKSFQLKASEYCVTDDQIDAAVLGAVWTFEQFREAMARRAVITHAP